MNPPPTSPAPKALPPLWRQSLDEMNGAPHPADVPFGGPLILVGIGRVLGVPLLLFGLVKECLVFAKPGVWAVLTNPDSSRYHPLWAPMIVFEIGAKGLLVLYSAILLWMYFTRKKGFRLLIICYHLATLAYLGGDLLLGSQIPAVSAAASAHDYSGLLRAVLSAVIWVPYFLTSQRAKEVFVH